MGNLCGGNLRHFWHNKYHVREELIDHVVIVAYEVDVARCSIPLTLSKFHKDYDTIIKGQDNVYADISINENDEIVKVVETELTIRDWVDEIKLGKELNEIELGRGWVLYVPVQFVLKRLNTYRFLYHYDDDGRKVVDSLTSR